MLFTIPQFIFAFYCGYSGQTIFDDNYISLYNLIFTSFPLAVRAIIEQDVNYVRPSKNVPNSEEATISHLAKRHMLVSQQAQFIPKNYELNKYLYRLFPKIYFMGQ